MFPIFTFSVFHFVSQDAITSKCNSINIYHTKRNSTQVALNNGMDLLAQVTKVQRLFRFHVWFDLDYWCISLHFFQLYTLRCVGFVLMPASLMVTHMQQFESWCWQPRVIIQEGSSLSSYHFIKQIQSVWPEACLHTNWLRPMLPYHHHTWTSQGDRGKESAMFFYASQDLLSGLRQFQLVGGCGLGAGREDAQQQLIMFIISLN